MRCYIGEVAEENVLAKQRLAADIVKNTWCFVLPLVCPNVRKYQDYFKDFSGKQSVILIVT
jgi:hypothetical protein